MNGLADPSAIIQTFWVDDGLGSLVTLYQTIALVDCKSFPAKIKSDKIAKEEEKQEEESSLLKEEPDTLFSESELLMR